MPLFLVFLGFLLCLLAALLVLTYIIIHSVGSFGVKKFDVADWTMEPEVPVKVKRLAEGGFKLRWQKTSELKTLHMGSDPAQPTTPVEFTTPAPQEAVIPAQEETGRLYFKLTFADGSHLMAAERFVPLDGAHNFRDLGGYETSTGQHVRWGKLFRTDALNEISPSDQEDLSAMGIKLVCDLRSLEEFEQSPDLLPEGIEQAHLPINTGNWMQQIGKTLFFKRRELAATMKDSYPLLLQNYPENIRGVLSRFADPNSLPAAFHCTAGKDRAGLTAALVLSLLGVPDETVVAEYSISNYSFEERAEKFNRQLGPRMRRYGIPLRDLTIFNAADPDWMASALTFIREEYGSTEDYLLNVVGLTAEDLAAIRENLLD